MIPLQRNARQKRMLGGCIYCDKEIRKKCRKESSSDLPCDFLKKKKKGCCLYSFSSTDWYKWDHGHKWCIWYACISKLLHPIKMLILSKLQWDSSSVLWDYAYWWYKRMNIGSYSLRIACLSQRQNKAFVSLQETSTANQQTG